MVKLGLFVLVVIPLFVNVHSRFVDFRDPNAGYGLSRTDKIDLSEEPREDPRYVPDDDVIYILYTRKNPREPQTLVKLDATSINSSYFDPSKPVKIATHGWGDNAFGGSVTIMKDAYLSVMDVNFIGLDWNKGCGGDYAISVGNTPKTGVSIAGFVDWLVEDYGVNPKEIHLMGHSLGGQMIGHIGRNVKNGQIGYITAMDPAGPLFPSFSSRLRKTDAEYVEVIHTNSYEFGAADPLGHNDFYPNGGITMAGCSPLDIGCNHSRCVYYIAESIRSSKDIFFSNSCDSVKQATSLTCNGTTIIPMGGIRPKPEVGILSLLTNAQSPFSMD